MMVSLAGPKSVGAKDWWNAFQAGLTVCDFKFWLVRQYKLLGGVIDASASLDPEISCRQSAMTMISAPYHRYIGTEAKLTLLQSLTCNKSMLVSSLSVNAHAQCNMSEAQLSQISSKLAIVYGACIPYKVMCSRSNDA